VSQKRLKIEDGGMDVKVKLEDVKVRNSSILERKITEGPDFYQAEPVVKDEVDIKPVKVEIKKAG
jgi:hypothetical protein